MAEEEEEEEELLDYEEEDVAPKAKAAAKAADGGGKAKGGDSKKKGYVGMHSTGFRDFLLKPELLRAIVDCGFEHPSEGEKSVSVSLSRFSSIRRERERGRERERVFERVAARRRRDGTSRARAVDASFFFFSTRGELDGFEFLNWTTNLVQMRLETTTNNKQKYSRAVSLSLSLSLSLSCARVSQKRVLLLRENSATRMHPASDSWHGRALPSKVGDGKNRGVCHHGVTTVRPDAKRGRCGHLVSHERTRVSNIARNDEV